MRSFVDRAYGDFGDHRAIPILVKLLQLEDSGIRVRACAAQSLGKFGPASKQEVARAVWKAVLAYHGEATW